jgi:hypothetical protein
METGFGHNFSAVRLFESPRAHSLGARAYTRGEHITFAPGAFDPETPEARRVLAHELTHVLQQRARRVALPRHGRFPINADSALEAEAKSLGSRVAQGERLPAFGPPPGSGGTAASAPAQPVQRLIAVDDDDEFTKTSKRPSWSQQLKRSVLKQYNENPWRQGKKLSPQDNLGNLGLDRAHRVSYSSIQRVLLGHLQGTDDRDKFKELTDRLYTDVEGSTEHKTFLQRRQELFHAIDQGKSKKAVATRANTLLRRLNSATQNVRIGSATRNRRIQEDLDPNFVQKPGGMSATPITRRVLSQGSPSTSGYLSLDPTGRVESSGMSEAGLAVRVADFTPKTQAGVKRFLPKSAVPGSPYTTPKKKKGKK